MLDPYRNLTPAQMALTPMARVQAGTYLMVPYDPVTNMGMYEDGHRRLFDAMMADLVALGIISQQMAALVAAASNQQTAIVYETATISRVDAVTFTVAGFRSNIYVVGRAVQFTQTSNATGRVVSSNYNSGAALTTVVVQGCVIDTGLTQIGYGPDPAVAAIVKMVGATLTTSGYQGAAPAPAAGQQNDFLAGDGTYHDPIIDLQVWS